MLVILIFFIIHVSMCLFMDSVTTDVIKTSVRVMCNASSFLVLRHSRLLLLFRVYEKIEGHIEVPFC